MAAGRAGRGRGILARNPTRADRDPGSFKINLRTARWSDFATGDAGGDPVSLAAYLAGISQVEAAERVAAMLGVEARDAWRDVRAADAKGAGAYP
jgi:hypothetical protein